MFVSNYGGLHLYTGSDNNLATGNAIAYSYQQRLRQTLCSGNVIHHSSFIDNPAQGDQYHSSNIWHNATKAPFGAATTAQMWTAMAWETLCFRGTAWTTIH